MSSYRHTELSFGWDILGDGATVLCPGKCIFQDIVQGKAGMKSSTVMENEEFCIQCFMNQMIDGKAEVYWKRK